MNAKEVTGDLIYRMTIAVRSRLRCSLMLVTTLRALSQFWKLNGGESRMLEVMRSNLGFGTGKS